MRTPTPNHASRMHCTHNTLTQLQTYNKTSRTRCTPTYNNASRTRRTPPTPDDASRMQYRHNTCATSPGPGPIVYLYIYMDIYVGIYIDVRVCTQIGVYEALWVCGVHGRWFAGGAACVGRCFAGGAACKSINQSNPHKAAHGHKATHGPGDAHPSATSRVANPASRIDAGLGG